MRLLADRRHRRREGAFVVQGIQPVWQAVEAGAAIEALIVAPGLLGRLAAPGCGDGRRAGGRGRPGGQAERRAVRPAFRPRGTDRAGRDRERAAAALQRAARRAALGLRCPARDRQPGQPRARSSGPRTRPGRPGWCWSARHRPVRPGGGEGVDGGPVRPAGGAGREAGEFFAWAADRRRHGGHHLGAGPGSFWDASYPRPLALLLGAEGSGLPGEVLARGDICVRIPMAGTAESLNLAVAAGLLLYEAQRGGGLDPA